VDKGTLIEFRLHGDRRLAVIDRPEGKKNWVVVDERGQSHTIHPRQVTYEVQGQAYKATEIPRFLEEVQDYLDPTSLEVAWELLVEDGEAVDPTTMAQLLFSDKSPIFCYAAHSLLFEDKLYFKQKGEAYEPRSASTVAELKHQQEVARLKQQESQEFFSRIEQALKGEAVKWTNSDRARIDALERYAVFAEEATHRTPALETLTALGRPDTPQAAMDY